MELGGRGVDGQRDVEARGEPGLADRLDDQVQRSPVGVQVRGEAPLVPDSGGQAVLLQHRLQRVVGLRPPLDGLGERGRADRRDHELLDVDAVVGVRPAVEDVHHGDRQQVRVRPAQVAEQRQARGLRGGLGHRHADAGDRVRSHPRLVRGPVQVDHGLVDHALIVGVEAEQLGLDLVDDGLDGPGDRLAAVFVTAVPQLHRLEGAGGRPARGGGAAQGAVVQGDLDFEGGVSAGIQNLPGVHRLDRGHDDS